MSDGSSAPDLSIATLGAARIDSPLAGMLDAWRTTEHYVNEDDRVLLDDTLAKASARGSSLADLPGGAPSATDASGNAKLNDIGTYLRERIAEHLGAAGLSSSIRYIDPSCAIRIVPANAYDKAYCLRLAHHAVYAAMSDRTSMVVGRVRRRFVHLPISVAVSRRNQVDPHGDLWMAVLETTGQPMRFGTPPPPSRARRPKVAVS